MQKKILLFALILMIISTPLVKAQHSNTDSSYKRWFVGSTLLLLGNLDNTNNPRYFQINVGYRVTPKDVIQFRFKRS